MVVNEDNVRNVRNQKGALKWVRKLSKIVETMAETSTKEVPMGVLAHETRDVIMKPDNYGQRLLKDEAQKKRQREREKKKQAKLKATKRGKREQKVRKQENHKMSNQAEAYSSDKYTSSSDFSDTTSSWRRVDRHVLLTIHCTEQRSINW